MESSFSSSVFGATQANPLKHSMTHPKYLHSNSTSHKWVFGAIAELIDNSVDAKATQFHMWAEPPELPTYLIFQDNGNGMSGEVLHKMLSFGHCDKGEGDIGKYGNGFKSGSMRIGQDALVFTKNGDTMSCGFLSQTFLKAVNATEVLVPMVSWLASTKVLVNPEDEKTRNSLNIMTRYSPYSSINALLQQFDKIAHTGTRIIIINLRLSEDQQFEFDFQTDPSDIRINRELAQHPANTDEVDVDYSLRAYCTILYLRPKMQIFIRGHRVRMKLLTHTLYRRKTTTYKPSSFSTGINAPNDYITITFGFNITNRYQFGMMLYNRNRLIRYYLRIGSQLAGNSIGNGVIGVVDVPYLQPTHNKQDFVTNQPYITLKKTLIKKLNEYWDSCHIDKAKGGCGIGEFWKRAKKIQLPTYVQCDNPNCMKWRKMEASESPTGSEYWDCPTNSNPEFADCSIPQESSITENTPFTKKRKRKSHQEKISALDNDVKKQEQILQKKRKMLEKTKTSGKALIGRKVKVYWQTEQTWFYGKITKYRKKLDEYQVVYEDGDIHWEKMDEDFEVLAESRNEDHSDNGIPTFVGGAKAGQNLELSVKKQDPSKENKTYDKLKFIVDSLSPLLSSKVTTSRNDLSALNERKFCKEIFAYIKDVERNKSKSDMKIKAMKKTIESLNKQLQTVQEGNTDSDVITSTKSKSTSPKKLFKTANLTSTRSTSPMKSGSSSPASYSPRNNNPNCVTSFLRVSSPVDSDENLVEVNTPTRSPTPHFPEPDSTPPLSPTALLQRIAKEQFIQFL